MSRDPSEERGRETGLWRVGVAVCAGSSGAGGLVLETEASWDPALTPRASLLAARPPTLISGAQTRIPGCTGFLEPSCYLLWGWPNLAAVGRPSGRGETGTPEPIGHSHLCLLEGPKVRVLVLQGEGPVGMPRPDLSRKRKLRPGILKRTRRSPGQRGQIDPTCSPKWFQKAGWVGSPRE